MQLFLPCNRRAMNYNAANPAPGCAGQLGSKVLFFQTGSALLVMKDIHEVLRQKESDLARVSQEVEALRCVAPLLAERDGDPNLRPVAMQSDLRPVNRWPLELQDPPRISPS